MLKKAMLVVMLCSSCLLFSGINSGVESILNSFFSHGTGGY